MRRVEAALKDLTESVQRLVVIEERQAQQNARLDKVEARIDALGGELREQDKRLSAWINRGLGAWALAGILWGVATFFLKAEMFK